MNRIQGLENLLQALHLLWQGKLCNNCGLLHT